MNGLFYVIAANTLIVTATALGDTPGAATQPALQIVERYAKTLAPFSHVSYTADIRGTKSVNGVPVAVKTEYGVSEDELGRGVFRMFYRRDRDRLDILQFKDGTPPGEPAFASAQAHLFHVVVDRSPAIVTYSDFVERRVDRRSPGGFSAADSVRMSAGSLWGGEALDGIMPGRYDADLPDILRRADDLEAHPDNSVPGHPAFVLRCTNGGYQYVVWLDASDDFVPRKIVQRRLDLKADGADITIDAIEARRVGGRWVALKAHITSLWRAGPDYTVRTEARYERSDPDFNPDFDRVHAFKMVVRPGTYAKNADDPRPIEWMFRDGEFLPKDRKAADPKP